MTDHRREQVLLDALDRLRGTGPEFDGFLANHGPMAAEALIRLGAAMSCQVGSTATCRVCRPLRWRPTSASARSGVSISATSNLLGDWTAFMRSQAERLGWEDLLLLWWPRLLPGLAASATHGVIRTAHALRSCPPPSKPHRSRC